MVFFTDVPDSPRFTVDLKCGICKGTGLLPWRWWWPYKLVTCPMCGGDGYAKSKRPPSPAEEVSR
jgi:DnaJ-class molecular chaperone